MKKKPTRLDAEIAASLIPDVDGWTRELGSNLSLVTPSGDGEYFITRGVRETSRGEIPIGYFLEFAPAAQQRKVAAMAAAGKLGTWRGTVQNAPSYLTSGRLTDLGRHATRELAVEAARRHAIKRARRR